MKYEARLLDGHMDAGMTMIEASSVEEAFRAATAWAVAGSWHSAGEVMLRIRDAEASDDDDDLYYGAIWIARTEEN